MALVETRVDKAEGTLNEHATRFGQAEDRVNAHDDLAALQKELREVKEMQHVHGQNIHAVSDTINVEAESRNVPDPAYVRPPIRTLLRLNVASSVNKVDVQATVDRWLQGTYTPSQYKLDGPDAGTHWALLFLAPPETAANMASKARGILRGTNGVWEVLRVRDQILYVKFDSPPNVRRVDTASSKLLRAIKEVHPDKAVELVKPRYHPQKIPMGTIRLDSVDLVSITAPVQDDPPEVLWDPSMLARHSLDKVAILAKYESLVSAMGGGRRPDTTAWCK
eukprot:4964180-Karenia_brevis.AAC.1